MKLRVLSRARARSVLVACLAAVAAFSCSGPREARPHKEWPIRSGDDLAAPVVHDPIHECAEAVHVTGFMAHAKVTVIANGNDVVGEAQPDFGFADIALTRPLNKGESITATQAVLGHTSSPSIVPVIVSAWPALPNGFPKPDVGDDLYECGRIVPVGDLVESVHVDVFAASAPVGSASSPTSWVPVWVAALQAGHKVTAQQIACADDPTRTIKSPLSDPVLVKPAPSPMPAPIVSTGSLIAGNDTVDVFDLLVGAHVRVYDGGTQVGGGYATAGGNWVPLSSPLSTSSVITATQELCGTVSQPSDPVRPTTDLKAPTVRGPVCAGQRFVIVDGTVVNANVIVFRNGGVVAQGGAGAGPVVIGLGDNHVLNANDVVTARQHFGNSALSPLSPPVTVVPSISSASVVMQGSEPFFAAESGEQSIGAPVFPRGRGEVRFEILTCCKDETSVTIEGPSRETIAKVALAQAFPGYWTGEWDWSSDLGWSVPGGIPIGEYTAVVHGGCELKETRAKFYVIFDPAEVAGPARYSFDETGVWFGTSSNATRALLYHLHPDDARVFRMAMQAAQGEVDAYSAAQKIARAEEAKFTYSLSYHGDDVLHMLTSESSAQCADDAGVLTALLRSVGIPAHPATADAGLETGVANWTFDTWTEFLASNGGSTAWSILHPHEYPGMSPESRNTFGHTRGVATKSFNDIVVYADTSWNWSEASDSAVDVSFGRNACQEPDQKLSKKSWVAEACEGDYWSPDTHWSCIGSGVGSSSSGLTVDWGADKGDLGLGRSVSGTLRIRNTTKDVVEGALTIDLVEDSPLSKQLGDRVVADGEAASVRLAPGESLEREYRFAIPRTIAAGSDLHLRARIGEARTFSERLDVERSVRVDVEVPGELRVDERARARFVVVNTTKARLDGVHVRLRLPPGLTAERAEWRFETLQPDERRVVDATWIAVAPLAAGSIVVTVDTANGGGVEAYAPVRVRESTPSTPTSRTIRRQ